jgi:hypothetical protein
MEVDLLSIVNPKCQNRNFKMLAHCEEHVIIIYIKRRCVDALLYLCSFEIFSRNIKKILALTS